MTLSSIIIQPLPSFIHRAIEVGTLKGGPDATVSMANVRGSSTRRPELKSITFVMIVMMSRAKNVSAGAATFLGCHRHRRHHTLLTSFVPHQRRYTHHDTIDVTLLTCRSRTRRLSDVNTSSHQLMPSANENFINLRIPTPEDMEDIGGLLSVNSTVGDIILLDGDLGAGKTCFSRGFVRGRTGLPNERVTSPTFLLSNTYPIDDDTDHGGGRGRIMIHHMDLYRLSGSDDNLSPLNLEHVFANAISLIEWPSRLSQMPSMRLDITLTIMNNATISQNEVSPSGDDTKDRFMKLVPYGDKWVDRLKFLNDDGYFEDLIVDANI
jgi:tRNA threonylcarbamoyladenosine biosynthesis protein TsaE